MNKNTENILGVTNSTVTLFLFNRELKKLMMKYNVSLDTDHSHNILAHHMSSTIELDTCPACKEVAS
jgi:hypothetical protein